MHDRESDIPHYLATPFSYDDPLTQIPTHDGKIADVVYFDCTPGNAAGDTQTVMNWVRQKDHHVLRDEAAMRNGGTVDVALLTVINATQNARVGLAIDPHNTKVQWIWVESTNPAQYTTTDVYDKRSHNAAAKHGRTVVGLLRKKTGL